MDQNIRKATKAGSWYESDSKKLNDELSLYLSKAEITVPRGKKLRAIIGPHAGYEYSGANAAWAYKNITCP